MCVDTPDKNSRVMRISLRQNESRRNETNHNKASFHMQNVPWTLRTAGSVVSIEELETLEESRMITWHTTTVLLYSSVAGKYKCVVPLVVVVSNWFSSLNSNPLTSQTIVTLVALILQLKLTIDSRVALTDVGVLTKAEIQAKNQVNMRAQCQWLACMH